MIQPSSARGKKARWIPHCSRVTVFAALTLLAAHQTSGALAQATSRPITIIVPFSPGTGPDILARLIGEELQKRRGQAVVVDNKPGASGAIGAQIAARAAPDGNTLVIFPDPPFTANVSLMKALPYHPVNSFTPVIEVAIGSAVLAVHASIPAQSTPDFIAYAKARPGQLNFGSSGIGSTHHLTMEAFKHAAQIDIAHVPFKDASGMISNLVGGHVGAGFLPLHQALPLPQDKVRLLALASKQRIGASPELPTLGEQGFAGLEEGFRLGVLAPAATPRDVVIAYNAAIGEIIRSPHSAERLAKIGLTPVGGTPDEYAKAIARDLMKWQTVLGAAGIAAQ